MKKVEIVEELKRLGVGFDENAKYDELQEKLLATVRQFKPAPKEKPPESIEEQKQVVQEEITQQAQSVLEEIKEQTEPVALATPEEPKHKLTFWCKRCNRGMAGSLYKNEDYEDGDQCPLCVDMWKSRKIAEHDIEQLIEIQRFQREHIAEGLRKRTERERKQSKGVKGAEELVRESEGKFKSKIESQTRQIQHLTSMVEKLTNKL